MPQVPSEEELHQYFTQLSNWGRWGDEDESGTLNYIDAAKVREARQLITDGITISCSSAIKIEPEPDHVFGAPQRFMVVTGNQPHPSEVSDGEGQEGPIEYFGLVFHGFTVTHLDAPCHGVWNGKMYNDKPAEMVTARSGALVNSVVSARSGIVTRGVLLDIAAAKGKRWLEPGEGVHPEDLEAAAADQRVEIGEGDAVFIRTGYGERRDEVGQDAKLVGQPGWHASCLPWLHERRVALIGSDSCQEVVPSGYDMVHPVHRVGLVAMGLWLLDNVEVAELLSACHARDRWEFCLCIAPLVIDGGTGSPVNPLAIF